MGLIEDISKMQVDGKNDFEIRSSLRQRGVSDSDIEGAMSQAVIKGAVGQASDYSQGYGQDNYSEYGVPQPQESEAPPAGYEGMEPSLISQEQPYGSGELQSDYQYQQPQMEYGGFGGYPQYQESVSSDVISEIAEQVVSDKLSMLNEKFEEAINFKNGAEAKLRNVEERIERIERVFDKLQLSIIQRVAEYVDDVKTIKKDLQETQKSFKAINAKEKKTEEKKFRYVE